MNILDLSHVEHHPAIEEVVDVLAARTQNNDRPFFRVTVAYFLSVMAATMRATMHTNDPGEIPVNSYTLALSPSGTGKGYSVGIMENEFMQGFRSNFVDLALPMRAEDNMYRIAVQRSIDNESEEKEELKALKREFEMCGAYPFVFDGGSSPAIKQIRQMLLLANSGSINLQIDEIGMNLEGSNEALTTFLEMFDQGMVKPKLTKNSNDNKRTKEIEGKTPANLLMFGTPSKLLDGSSTEDRFYTLLETGYARRCLFALGKPIPASDQMSSEEIYDTLSDPSSKGTTNPWSDHFSSLAHPDKFDWAIDVGRDVGIMLIEYKVACETAARTLPEHDEIRRAEVNHRYFKALKLAGALAFVDEATEMTEDHLLCALKLVEESGIAFHSILTREKAYMKLARYVASSDIELTHSDLFEALPFYKSGSGARNEMMTMATAWGYKQHIVVKKRFQDGIEFFSGETLKETVLSDMKLSFSDDYAYDYETVSTEFDDIKDLVTMDDHHWASHGFRSKHRKEENAIPGFDLAVLDIDGTAKLKQVQALLGDYKFMTHTTKRHTKKANRFRLIMPLNYYLKLDADDYTEFMQNIAAWLPFDVDMETHQRSRKWLTNPNAKVFISKGTQLLDVLPFVPKTAKNEAQKKENANLQSLDNLERWFAQRMASGNRNNHMIKFALALVDSGMDYDEVEESVIAFNAKMNNALPESELQTTVLKTVAKRMEGDS